MPTASKLALDCANEIADQFAPGFFDDRMVQNVAEIIDQHYATVGQSLLPYEQQSLVYRLRRRAEIRRQIPTRKSVQAGEQDRLADLLEEAADRIEELENDSGCAGMC